MGRPPSRDKDKDKKLLQGEFVEVRQREDGLRGSWFEGVVTGISNLCRTVKYKYLLRGKTKTNLVERVKVTPTVDGRRDRARVRERDEKYRGWIRPMPPALNCEVEWKYGLCVDAFFGDGWWEGVLWDHCDDCQTRSVFFPDEGDEQLIDRVNLRVTQDWDEVECKWNIRGKWILLDLLKEFEQSECFHTKVVWYYLRQRASFRMVAEWTRWEEPSQWRLCLGEVIQLLMAQPKLRLLPALEKHEESLRSKVCLLKDSEGAGKDNRTQNSSMDKDDNLRAIVCHQTVGQEGPSGAILASGSAVALYFDKRNSSKSVGHETDKSQVLSPQSDFDKELCNASFTGEDSGVQAIGLDKEPSKANRSSGWMIFRHLSRSFGESQEAKGAHVKDQACSIGREPCHNAAIESYLKEQMDYSDRVLLKDLVVRPNLKELCKRSSDRVSSDVLDSGSGLKDNSEYGENGLSKSPFYEANSMDQTGCSDKILSEALTNMPKDQLGCKKDTKLSLQLSEALAVCERPVQKCNSGPVQKCNSGPVRKRNPGRRSTPTQTPARGLHANRKIFDPAYCPAAVLNYNPSSDKKSKKQDRMKAKMHLLAEGWRQEIRPRSAKGRYDMLYVSPNGTTYYSLFRACLAWKKEQEAEGLINANHQDNLEAEKSKKYALGNVSASLLLQEPGVRTRNMLSSIPRLPKRSQRIHFLSGVARYESKNDKTDEDASKIYKGFKLLVSKSKRFHKRGNKKRSGSCEVCSDPESTPRTNRSNFQSDFIGPDDVIANSITEVSNSKKSGLDLVPVSGWNQKRDKLDSKDSLEDTKQKEARSGQLVLKTMRKFADDYQMQVLLPTTGKSNDSFLRQGKRTVRSVLSWMIENKIVHDNERVFYRTKKDNSPHREGRITCGGILCTCCNEVYTLTNFEAHVGSKLHRPSANLFLENGRTLLDCQMETLGKRKRADGHRGPSGAKRKKNIEKENDDFCQICCGDGTLLLCDQCPSSFHFECINLNEEDVPPKDVKWYCANCCCASCGFGTNDGVRDGSRDMNILVCGQCEHQYHVGCFHKEEMTKLESCPKSNCWFCSNKCSVIFSKLQNLVGKVNPVGKVNSVDALSWTLLRSTEEGDQLNAEVMAESHNKLSVALSVMHECFASIHDNRTKRDLFEEIIFSRGRDRNTSNFRGFYTMILENKDNLISVATVRIYGERVAEMPFIATRVEYRRQGMCRLLVKELEKLLSFLGVERLILPAIPQLRQAWKESFGFQEMSSAERFELLDLSFVNFPQTTIFQKLLIGSTQQQGENDAIECSEVFPLDLSIRHGLEIQEQIVPEKTEISAEPVIPIRSLPCHIDAFMVPHCNAGGEGSADGKLKQSLSRGCQHPGSTSTLKKKYSIEDNTMKKIVCRSERIPMVDDADESSKVIVTETRSKRKVRQVKEKDFSYYGKEHKTVQSEYKIKDRRNKDRKKGSVDGNVCKRRRKEENVTDDKPLVISCPDSLESLQKKHIQFGAYERRKAVEEMPMTCRTNLNAAASNFLSKSQTGKPVCDRPSFDEDGSNCVVTHKENFVFNSRSCNERYTENGYGRLNFLHPYKFHYQRRNKQTCGGSGLSGEISSGESLPVRSSILHSNATC